MKFVTKQEYEKALKTIQDALESGQLVHGHYTSEPIRLERLIFTNTHDTVDHNQVSFVSPELAVKERLLELRRSLEKIRRESREKSLLIENLEKQEKELVTTVASFKE